MNKYAMTLALLFIFSTSAYAVDTRLIEAVKAKDFQSVLLLLQQVNINEQLPGGATALHWAVHRDDMQIIELLIQAGADVNTPDQGGATPLWMAVNNVSSKMVERLLSAGADPNISLSMGETPLMTASEIGDLRIVKDLLSARVDVNAKGHEGGQTALMWAVAEDHSEIVQALIDHGASVHERSTAGSTPLHFAALNGSLESARILLSMDVDVNAMAIDNMSPLLMAAANGHNDMTQFLLEQGADPNASDDRGYTALHFASIQRKMLDSVRGLLAYGADPNARILNAEQDYELLPVPDLPFLQSPTRIVETGIGGGTLPAGATPIILAAQQRNAPAMRLLAEGGADISLRTTESVYFLGGSGRRVNYIAGTTALMAAAGMDRVADNWYGYTEVVEKQALEAVKLAAQLGADVNATNEYGMSALHAASAINADTIIEFLVKNGADIDAKDQFGQTPLSIASLVITAGLKDNLDVRPRRSSPSTFALLMKLGATPLKESGVVARE